MNIQYMILAFIGGGLGTIIGGTQTFIITGLVGILAALMTVSGVSVEWFNNTVLNLIFLPCVIFNGAVLATGYASLKYDIKGYETGRSLAFTADPIVFLMGCSGGFIGYVIYILALEAGLKADQGALSVILLGILTRLLFNHSQYYNPKGIRFLKENNSKYWLFLIFFSSTVSYLTAYCTEITKFYTIGFSISALSLIFVYVEPSFPATHHITLVSGYAMMCTHNMLIAVLFGILSQIITDNFGRIFNIDCGTHIDPPAVAIFCCSLILFTFFR